VVAKEYFTHDFVKKTSWERVRDYFKKDYCKYKFVKRKDKFMTDEGLQIKTNSSHTFYARPK
jgi:hypothetical protein